MNELESDEEVPEDTRLTLARSNEPIRVDIIDDKTPSLNKPLAVPHCPSFLLKLAVHAFLYTSFLCEADVEQILQHWCDDLRSVKQLQTNCRKLCAIAMMFSTACLLYAFLLPVHSLPLLLSLLTLIITAFVVQTRTFAFVFRACFYIKHACEVERTLSKLREIEHSLNMLPTSLRQMSCHNEQLTTLRIRSVELYAMTLAEAVEQTRRIVHEDQRSTHAIFDVHKLASCEAYEQIREWVRNMRQEVANDFSPTEHQVKALHSAQMLALSEFLSCACCFVRYGNNERLSFVNESFASITQVMKKQLHHFKLASQVFIWQKSTTVERKSKDYDIVDAGVSRVQSLLHASLNTLCAPTTEEKLKTVRATLQTCDSILAALERTVTAKMSTDNLISSGEEFSKCVETTELELQQLQTAPDEHAIYEAITSHVETSTTKTDEALNHLFGAQISRAHLLTELRNVLHERATATEKAEIEALARFHHTDHEHARQLHADSDLIVHQQAQSDRSEQEVNKSSTTKSTREEQTICAAVGKGAPQARTVMEQLRAAMTAQDEDIYDFPDENEISDSD